MPKGSQNESIRRATLLMTNLEENARIKALAPAVGLNVAETLAELERLSTAASTAIDHQDALEGAALEMSREIQKDHDERWAIYKDERYHAHGKIQQADQLKVLRLKENLPSKRDEQIGQMLDFYTRALDNPAIVTQLAKVSVTPELLEQGRSVSAGLAKRETQLTLAVSNQKEATREQTQALAVLDAFRRKINRLLLIGSDNDPAVKDALGM